MRTLILSIAAATLCLTSPAADPQPAGIPENNQPKHIEVEVKEIKDLVFSVSYAAVAFRVDNVWFAWIANGAEIATNVSAASRVLADIRSAKRIEFEYFASHQQGDRPWADEKGSFNQITGFKLFY